jgi:glycosyltransferase involved in cell wall biosynthesis
MNSPTITIGVPAYSRPQELRQLLDSVLDCSPLPDEVLICEDASPRRDEIRVVMRQYARRFEGTVCALRYVENPSNLGYDGNLRKVIAGASCDYVMLLGNDDAVYPGAIGVARSYISNNPDVKVISRTYSRFTGTLHNVINTTWIGKDDGRFSSANSRANVIFRLCGFVGGLLIHRAWAAQLDTDRYDGSLYYQYYLSCHAYFNEGIGYIAASIVAGRAGNPPLFGAAPSEKAVHAPGSYRPEGRARMWAGVLRISEDVESQLGVSFVPAVRKELAGRQAFHIFEMLPQQGRKAAYTLFRELRKLGLTQAAIPWMLTLYILCFGSRSAAGFRLFRGFQFFVERRLRYKL